MFISAAATMHSNNHFANCYLIKLNFIAMRLLFFSLFLTLNAHSQNGNSHIIRGGVHSADGALGNVSLLLLKVTPRLLQTRMVNLILSNYLRTTHLLLAMPLTQRKKFLLNGLIATITYCSRQTNVGNG